MHTFQVTSHCIIGPTGSSMNKHDCVVHPSCAGEAYLRLEEEESGTGEVQVCSRLQDQGTEETNRTTRERHQSHEGTDPGSK